MMNQTLRFSVRSFSSRFLQCRVAPKSASFRASRCNSTQYTTMLKHHRQAFSTTIPDENWEDWDIDAAIVESINKFTIQLVRVWLFPKSSGDDDSRKFSTLYNATWLWCNDPSYMHASSGQRTRSTVSFFSERANMISVEITYPDSNSSSSDTYGVYSSGPGIPRIQPITPPPGSLHPNGGVFATTKSDSNTDLAAPKLEKALLRVLWASTKGAVVSYYPVPWLLRCRHDDLAVTDRDRMWKFDFGQNSEIVRSGEIAFQAFSYSNLFVQGVPSTDAEMLNSSSLHCFRLMHSIVRDGAAVVRNSINPYDEGIAVQDDKLPVAILGKKLSGGLLSHGQLYGDVFHVRDQETVISPEKMENREQTPAANNIAYTSLALCPHQDLAYYESIPGLQLLHCVANDPDNIIGGESTLIDVVKAAEKFRLLAPKFFDTLTKCEATFMKQRSDADMIYRRPHILLSPSSGAVMSVRWSPPFEGPLFLSPMLMQDYFLAYAAFERMLDSSLPRYAGKGKKHRSITFLPSQLEGELCDYAHENTWEYRLKPGEILVFNNQRMLHGRRAFSVRNLLSDSGQTSGRHLVGCYTNIDDTLNKYRILRRSFFRDQYRFPYVPYFGNGSSHNF